MNFDVHIERRQARSPFRISGKVFDYFESVVVELEQDAETFAAAKHVILLQFYRYSMLQRL